MGTIVGFSVDTHLLRELGELLVGRDSTAVLELVKNAYDADATRVVIEGVDLGRPGGELRVVDDGHGMTRARFEAAFLRIAGRAKEGEDRRSPRFRRRYTGQKGIGRLAAHKLAGALVVTSVPVSVAGPGVYAKLDWDLIEEQHDLGELPQGLTLRDLPVRAGDLAGTTLTLGRLKSDWRDLVPFVTELRSAQPPPILVGNRAVALAEPPMIARPLVRSDGERDDPGFAMTLAGDLDVGEDLWPEAAQRLEWLLEVDALTDTVRYQVTPLNRDDAQHRDKRTYRFQRSVALKGRPAFQARVFTLPEASTRRGPLKGFVRSSTGVRVYVEGFRVQPYGNFGDDWLSIDRDYRLGPRFYTLDIDEERSDRLELDRRENLHATGNQGYVGGVFLTQDHAGALRPLVNREGFVQDAAYEAMVDIVQTGIRLTVRVRRSVGRADRLAKEEADAKAKAKPAVSSRNDRGGEAHGPMTDPPGQSAPDGFAAAGAALGTAAAPAVEATVRTARDVVASVEVATLGPGVEQLVHQVADGFRAADAELTRLRELQPELRILASVGLQLGAFVHDVNGMLGQAQTVRELLEPLTADPALTTAQARRVRQVVRALDDLAHALARQSSYLTDVMVADPRRRRSRVRIADRLDVVRRLLVGQLAARDVRLESALPVDLKTPPMFPAEVGVLLTNLLTNAVKNAGSPGMIRVDGTALGSRGAIIGIHNTGVGVDLTDAERWFLPFESTTVEIDEVLGQGLGLGLPITRALVEDYRGTIRFVDPPPGFATSIEVRLPDMQDVR